MTLLWVSHYLLRVYQENLKLLHMLVWVVLNSQVQGGAASLQVLFGCVVEGGNVFHTVAEPNAHLSLSSIDLLLSSTS